MRVTYGYNVRRYYYAVFSVTNNAIREPIYMTCHEVRDWAREANGIRFKRFMRNGGLVKRVPSGK